MKLLLLLSVFLTFCSFVFAEEVSILVGDKKLCGELSEAVQNKSLAVFILSGSGPTDRDGNTVGAVGKSNSLKHLADALSDEGITTLRVDKRGIGASANAAIKETDLRFSTYVEDAKHWIKFLEGKGYTEVVLVGHSEGALVATLAASVKSVKGLVCLAGAGRSAPVVLREQLKLKVPEELYTQADKIIVSLTEGKIVNDVPVFLNALFRPSVQPYLISWFQLDPAKAVSEVNVPVLIVQGSTDLQVSTKDAELGGLLAQTPSYFNPKFPLHKELAKSVISFVRSR